MTSTNGWKEVYKAARQELAPAKTLELCHECRRLIQQELSSQGTELGDFHRETLEEALRSVWIMEQEILNPKIH